MANTVTMSVCPGPRLSWVLLPIDSSSFCAPCTPGSGCQQSCLPAYGSVCGLTLRGDALCQSPCVVSHPASSPDRSIPCTRAPASPNGQPLLNWLGSPSLLAFAQAASSAWNSLPGPPTLTYLEPCVLPPYSSPPTAPRVRGPLLSSSVCSLETFEGGSFVQHMVGI